MEQMKAMFANVATKVRENKALVIKGAAVVAGATLGIVVATLIAKHQEEREMLFNEDGFLGEIDDMEQGVDGEEAEELEETE